MTSTLDFDDTPPILRTAGDGSPMALIPAGEFQMGSNDGEDCEKPVHTVYLDAFYIDVYPVTVGQYKRFLKATGHCPPDWREVEPYAPTDNHPIIYVNWYDAFSYCKWAGKTLPTEAQWEYAARGGLAGKKYPWGDELDDTLANFGFHVCKTTPVGEYPTNGYATHDMMGNVWEWCLDEYNSCFYIKSLKKNPVAGDDISLVTNHFMNIPTVRVLRGGGWSSVSYVMSVARRRYSHPGSTRDCVGFRCTRPVSSANWCQVVPQ